MILLLTMLASATPASDPLVDAVANCLAIVDPATRLPCLDAAARALVDGINRHEVTVVRREEVRRVRRSLFGIEGDPGAALPGAAAERIDSLDTSVAAAMRGDNDRWVLRLAEGGRWETTEPWLVGRDPKPGMTATIRRGSLGAFILKVGNERSVRVRRIN